MSLSFDPTTLHSDLFIDGAWQEAASGATFPVENPATKEIIAHVADGGSEDATLAIQAAGRAQAVWGKSTPRERADILRRAFDLVIANTDRLAAIMTAEMGKPLAEAKGEVAYGAEMLRWFSEEAVRIGGDHSTSVDGNTRIMITKEPIGPCVLVTPWNFPLAMGARKIAPAVAAGCTMVFKPAELTPLTSLALVQIFREAGLPDGVLNVVTTSSAASVVEPGPAAALPGRSASPAPPGWARSCCARRPITSCAPRWNWAETPRSSSWPTQTSKRQSTGP